MALAPGDGRWGRVCDPQRPRLARTRARRHRDRGAGRRALLRRAERRLRTREVDQDAWAWTRPRPGGTSPAPAAGRRLNAARAPIAAARAAAPVITSAARGSM